MAINASKSVVTYKGIAPAPEDRAWDADAALSRVRVWASKDGSGSKEQMDWGKYQQAFAWHDAAKSEDYDGYKLPHHDIIDGKPVTVFRGVVAAMGSLLGARGGVDIPETDHAGVYKHLSQHYDQFDRDAPEKKAAVQKSWGADVKIIAKNLEQRLVYGIVYEPDKVDAQDDYANADEIERGAHKFMVKLLTQGYQRIKVQHRDVTDAVVVESFIAPVDYHMNGEYVRKGSWVLVVKVLADEVWAKVVNGEINGYSLGGRARGMTAAN